MTKKTKETTIDAFKGFDKDFRCQGFQYEAGKEYKEKSASLCESGFHACEVPADTWNYYPPVDGNSYGCATLGGVTDEKRDDSKRCGTKIKVTARLSIADLIKAQVKWTSEHSKGKASTAGDDSHASTAGVRSHASTAGVRSHAALGKSRAQQGKVIR